MREKNMAFHKQIVDMIKDGLHDEEISNLLNIPIKKVRKTKYLYNNGMFYDKKKTRLSKDEIATIVDMIGKKYNYTQIGKVLNRDPTTIYRILQRNGMISDKVKEVHKTFEDSFYRKDDQVDKSLSNETINMIKEDYNRGKSAEKIAKRFDVSTGQVWRIAFQDRQESLRTQKEHCCCKPSVSDLVLSAEKHLKELTQLIDKLKHI